MAAESNTGFHREGTLPSALNRHAISFQSGAINSDCTTDMVPIGMGSYFGINTSTSSSLMLPGSFGLIGNNNSPGGSGSGGIIQAQAGNSSASSSLLLDSVPGLKHDAGLAVEWSVEEQYKLEEGLHKHADEPTILRYIKIAAMLRDKTVRDVALRCRWMMRKRRKAEDYNMGKMINNRKDKLVESSSKMNMAAALPQNMAAYPLMMHHMDQSEPLPFEGISGMARLLDQNAQAFRQISANLSIFKLQDNIDLLCHTRNNITAILNDMREMPGMSQMPPLPVSINEDLANSILPNTVQDHVTVRESVVDVLSEISKYCDIYLMERTLDDESGKLADIGFTFQPLDQVERINFKKYELEALFSLKGGKMEWRFRELLRVEKFCYLLNVPNSSEVICPPPLDDVNDSAELFGLNRRKVLAMIQGCKIRPVGLVRTTMDTRSISLQVRLYFSPLLLRHWRLMVLLQLGLVHRCGGLGFGVASEFNGVVLVMGLVGAWLVLRVGCEVSSVGSGGAV
ncbi:hypothetical protein D5086_019763 [Populus alba]|uniref:Uncharacterized protein n=1 Tax=Populus alba TaxID=43335 RepID=A0ACC4BJM2_POPAL